jgi:molecular chaperone GrpE
MTDDRDNEQRARPRIKITDKRRVRDDGSPETAAPARRAGAEPSGESESESAELSELEAARADAAGYLDHLRRLQAEFDNYRKRTLKEQTHAIEMAAQPVILRLLEVLDEFELALMAANDRPDFDRFLHGVELVYAKLIDSLRAEGLEKIEAQGRPFDPLHHEALMQSGEAEGEPVVADVLRPGYMLRGRVIRPAGVKVVRR